MKKNITLCLLLLCASFAFAQNTEDKYERKVLLEEFTSEKCSGCPSGARMIAELLYDKQYTDKVIVVAHHAGYSFDWLTTDADQELEWFYNGQTYAPSMMFDRYPFFKDYFSPEYGNSTPLYFMTRTDDLKKYVNKRLDVKSNVGFEIKGEYDENKTLTVRIQGDRLKEFCSTDPRINVYITEDRIPAKNQSNASRGYKHSHVMRAYNATWGEIIKWEGNSFVYECTFDIDPSWNKEELNIVAFVSAFDSNDPTKCVVENTRSIPFSMTSGIDDINAVNDNATHTEYYNLDGTRTTADGQGLKIVKETYSDGTKKVRKITR